MKQSPLRSRNHQTSKMDNELVQDLTNTLSSLQEQKIKLNEITAKYAGLRYLANRVNNDGLIVGSDIFELEANIIVGNVKLFNSDRFCGVTLYEECQRAKKAIFATKRVDLPCIRHLYEAAVWSNSVEMFNMIDRYICKTLSIDHNYPYCMPTNLVPIAIELNNSQILCSLLRVGLFDVYKTTGQIDAIARYVPTCSIEYQDLLNSVTMLGESRDRPETLHDIEKRMQSDNETKEEVD